MERIDLRKLGDLLRIIAMMARWMMWIRDADLRIRTIVVLACELEADDTRDIRLKGQNLQVVHQLGVVGEHRRNSYRPVEVGRLVVRHRFLATLDFPLYLPQTLEILFQAHVIGCAYLAFNPRDAPGQRIEQAPTIAERCAAFGRIAALAEKPLEDDARMPLGRKRGCRRRPGEAV